MKKLFLLIIITFLLSGCTNIEQSSYDQIISDVVTSNEKISNTYRKGYKFYLPSGLYVSTFKENNESFNSSDNTYYMYVDLINYLNKKPVSYEINNESVYSSRISYANKSGYIEINRENDKYLVEIMYNYAKIEVMVEERYVKRAVADSIIILSSIEYNEEMLKKLSSENLLNYNEENLDIFKKSSSSDNSNFLKYVEEYDSVDETIIPDYDLIN